MVWPAAPEASGVATAGVARPIGCLALLQAVYGLGHHNCAGSNAAEVTAEP